MADRTVLADNAAGHTGTSRQYTDADFIPVPADNADGDTGTSRQYSQADLIPVLADNAYRIPVPANSTLRPTLFRYQQTMPIVYLCQQTVH